ncbi:MAG: tetratricopeptide repeat protein [Candidatus Eisenbacteria bacterium]|nr:tetratricopeptide repeat protein [Candidatus Eisenbacteria bacterium]
MRLSDRTLVVLLFVAAWILRAVFVLELRASPLADAPLLDELYHVQWASALAAGDWVGSAVFFRAPLYPYSLALALLLFRGSLLGARLLQATYGALVPVAAYLLAKRLLGRRGAVVAGIVAALYPFLIYFTNELLIESLVVALGAFLLLAVLRADEVPSWGRWLSAGAMLGLAALTRPPALLFAPCVMGWIWWRAASASRPDDRQPRREPAAPRARGGLTVLDGRTPLRSAVLRSVVFLLGAGIVIAPVTIRNFALERDLVLIASQGGVNFFIGNNRASDGASAVLPVLGDAWEYEDCVRVAEREEGRTLSSSGVSAFWYRKGREFILGHPREAAALFARKVVLFWNRYELPNNKDVYHFARMSRVYGGVAWLHFGVVAPLAAVGAAVTLRRRHPTAVLLALFVAAHMTGVVLFFVCSRFRIPVVPALIVFAAAGALWLVDRVRSRDARRFVAGAALVACAAALVNADFYGTHLGDRAQTRYQIGAAHAMKGRHDAAIEEFLKAIEMSGASTPTRAKAQNAMGLSLEKLGRSEEALAAYRASAHTAPTFAPAANNAGWYHLKRGELEPARAWLEEAVRRDPWLPEAQFNLGTVLLREGDLAGAEQRFSSAVMADPRFKEAWNGLGAVFEDTGRLPESIAAYGRAVQIDGSYANARNNLGVALARTGQYGEALAELDAALRLDPGNRNIAGNIEQVRRLMAAARTGGGPAPLSGPRAP